MHACIRSDQVQNTDEPIKTRQQNVPEKSGDSTKIDRPRAKERVKAVLDVLRETPYINIY